jgi:hypothetical protein
MDPQATAHLGDGDFPSLVLIFSFDDRRARYWRPRVETVKIIGVPLQLGHGASFQSEAWKRGARTKVPARAPAFEPSIARI